jgi:hypothetical protein
MPTRLIARTAALLAVTSLSLTACDDTDANHLVPADSSDGSSEAGSDAVEIDGADDAAETDTAETDSAELDGGDIPDADVPERARVEVDLTDRVQPGAAGDGARAFCGATAEQLVSGELIDGRPGDCVIENDHVRFVVAFGDNAISPCSRDGTIVDAELRGSADWQESGDVMGEICLLLNIAQTFAPERVEVLADGTDGYAVLAYTGGVATLDFLNITQMAEERFPGLIQELPLDPDRPIPASITVYYVLNADDRSVQVVTALRNDGTDAEFVAAGHMVMSGSTGGYFNPLGGTNGFDYQELGADSLQTAPTPFIAYLAEHAGYAFMPEPDPSLEAEWPVGAGQIAISGVAVAFFGSLNLVEMVLTPPSLVDRTPGFYRVEPGATITWAHQTWVGDGSLATMVDPMWEAIGVPTATLRGSVNTADLAPVHRATVTAIDARGRTLNQARTQADGTWSLAVPAGTYTLRARSGPLSVDAAATPVAAGAVVDIPALGLPAGGTLTVTVTNPAGEAVPARITVQCEGACPSRPTRQERPSGFLVPNGWERIVSTGVSGAATIDLAPGDYRVMVSRGLEYSVWPPDAFETGGELVSIAAGDVRSLQAEIAQVIDTSGVLSGDFHIHAMASSDSEVSDRARVLDFLGEGVDVMVSTDHDVISDFAPTIAALGAQDWIASLIGAEITTPNIGHFNAFPLTRSEERRRGGALDWSGGDGPNLTPAGLYAAAHAAGTGERVVQINHPGSTIPPLKADVLTGQTFADPGPLRMPATEPDPATGDTGLWSDDFTAMEVMNGHNRGNFWGAFRWWITMIGRGHTPAGTAVTDTHGLYGDLGGSPRSYVFVGDGADGLPLDSDAFVAAINSGRLVGTNGPFVRFEVANADGDVAALGDTLAVDETGATGRVTVELPEYMRAQTIDVYLNARDERDGDTFVQDGTPVPPTFSVAIPWEESDLTIVAQGAFAHRAWRRTVEFPIDVDEDAWVLVVVHDATDDRSLSPLIGNTGVRALAFTNPIFLDADGGGFDRPPLLQLAAERAVLPREFRERPRWPAGHPISLDAALELLEAGQCAHERSHALGERGHSHAH